MADTNYNPIRTVNGAVIPCPSSYKWTEEDISGSDAGRTEDTVMDKKRIGQAVKLELAWQNPSIEDAATVLRAFDPEYISVCYLDAKKGQFITSTFYVGSREGVLYNAALGVWSKISFNIIERDGR